MSYPLLLDGMFSADIADHLRKLDHDALAVVADPALVGLPDDQILAESAAAGRALVTANIKDYVVLDAQYRTTGRRHAGLVLVSTKTFPQNRSLPGALTQALVALLSARSAIGPDRIVFLGR